jgi:hypothetical protein
VIDPNTTLVIILGVSSCPRAPKLQSLPQCANSAKDFSDYLRSSLQLPSDNLLNLFNSQIAASEQIDQIEEWLFGRTNNSTHSPTDLMLYYSGHGGLARNDQSYFLAVHRTRDGAEGATSIRYVDLASSIKRHAGGLRKYLILDCCFAASAVIKTQADISQVVLDRVENELPPSGTAVLCSSSAKLVSIAPPGERYTMFSGALLQCLKEGIPGGPEVLSLEDLGMGARRVIQTKYPNDAVRPEIHVPEQTRGDPAKVPLFPNVFRKKGPSDEGAKTPETTRKHWLGGIARSPLGRMALGAGSGLVASIVCALTWFPYNYTKVPPFDVILAPVVPAICLATAIVLVGKSVKGLTWKSGLFVYLATYLAWMIAWSTAYYSVLYFGDAKGSSYAIRFNTVLAISSGAAGYFGSGILHIGLLFIVGGKKTLTRTALRSVSLKSIACGLWGAISTLPLVLGITDVLDLTHSLGLFLPWQSYYMSAIVFSDVNKAEKPNRSEQFYWFLSSVILLSLLMPRTVRIPLNTLVNRKAPISVAVYSSTGTTVMNSERHVIVNYNITNNTLLTLSCDAEFLSAGRIYSSTSASQESQFGNTSTSSEFNVPQIAGDTKIRLICSSEAVGYTTPWQDVYVSDQ